MTVSKTVISLKPSAPSGLGKNPHRSAAKRPDQ
jgi:hypothetical protein